MATLQAPVKRWEPYANHVVLILNGPKRRAPAPREDANLIRRNAPHAIRSALLRLPGARSGVVSTHTTTVYGRRLQPLLNQTLARQGAILLTLRRRLARIRGRGPYADLATFGAARRFGVAWQRESDRLAAATEQLLRDLPERERKELGVLYKSSGGA
jgi:hypothetical protein